MLPLEEKTFSSNFRPSFLSVHISVQLRIFDAGLAYEKNEKMPPSVWLVGMSTGCFLDR